MVVAVGGARGGGEGGRFCSFCWMHGVRSGSFYFKLGRSHMDVIVHF